MVPSVGMDPGEYCTWGFCNINSGMRIGLVRGLSAIYIGGKTYSAYGKV